jgi:dethiobiotin synthetase
VNTQIVVTGTDTGIGKTVFAAGLTRLLDGFYWKPVQAGLDGETDAETVRRLSGLESDRILPEVWRLKTPCSPHLAAEHDGLTLSPDALSPPLTTRPLVIEGAGGLMVPLTRRNLLIDVFARWGAPTVLCARTTLGTINHTLLSLEALRRRHIPIIGVAFVGDPHADNERTIESMSGVRILGRLPRLDPMTPEALRASFAAAFAPAAFTAPNVT